MPNRIRTLLSTCLTPAVVLSLAMTVVPAERMTPEKLFELGRIGDAVVSPDGKQIAYLVTNFDLAENSSTTSLLIQPLSAEPTDKMVKGFGTPLAVTQPTVLLKGIKGLSSLNWIHRPDGDRLLYIAPGQPVLATADAAKPDPSVAESGDATSKVEEPGKPQAWILDPANPGSAKQITSIEEGIGNLKPSPTGDAIAFSVSKKLDQTVNELYPDLPKADARIIDSLMYRHWNAWHDFTYSHLHVAKLADDGTAQSPVDLMPDMHAHCPLPPFGGSEQFSFSPDGTEIALTLKLAEHPAESTDSGVYLAPVAGGPLKLITPDMPGYDVGPSYSPDGRFIAFHSMERASFEADRNRIMLYDRSSGGVREATHGLDQTAHDAIWSSDSQSIYFYSETKGTVQAYRIGVDGSGLKQITSGMFDFSTIGLIPNSPWLLVAQQNNLRPTELTLVQVDDGKIVTVTDVNGALYEPLELPKIEERIVTATDGEKIHSWVIFPPDYDAKSDKKWPMLTYCQGGPQGQVGQWFSYRWNFHLMAAKGYVALAINRRGLPGFGQKWNDQISGDWGGQAMKDILSATDAMLGDPTIDRDKVAAVGASYGGYTVYWLMGNAEKRFRAMIAHCGVFNLESMYGSTEELFFVNFDMGGPYWSSLGLQEKYNLFSPHRFVGNWQTPLLVIHGEKDFRVPITQGIEAFTAAQVQRVPSRFLYFPDEGHWVNKPQNSVLWQRVFFDWVDRYCK